MSSIASNASFTTRDHNPLRLRGLYFGFFFWEPYFLTGFDVFPDVVAILRSAVVVRSASGSLVALRAFCAAKGAPQALHTRVA